MRPSYDIELTSHGPDDNEAQIAAIAILPMH